VVVLIMNLALYRYLFNVDEFVSEAIGTQVSNNIVQPDKLIQNFGMSKLA